MNRKAVKELKTKLMQEKIGKVVIPELPIEVSGERSVITRIQAPEPEKKELSTVPVKLLVKRNRSSEFETSFKSEPSMPGFNSFCNAAKLRKSIAIMVVILATFFNAKAQHKYNPCVRSFSPTGSVWAGVNKLGFNVGMEFGVWGVDQPFGGTLGFVISNDYVESIIDGKTQMKKEPTLDLILRLTAKVAQNEAGTVFHMVTGYGTINGDFGGSYRLYRAIGDYVLVGLEPKYSGKYGGSCNGVLTLVFK